MTIEFPSDITKCEKTLKNGLNSLVSFRAKWCGACHQFKDNVWNSLTSLKNRNMNLVSVDSNMAPKVIQIMGMKESPPFYPYNTVTGNDGKAATFKDEKGNSTNAMPRKETLPEDKKFLTQLITTNQPNMNGTMNKSSNKKNMVKLNLSSEDSTPRAKITPQNNGSKKSNSLATSPVNYETIIPSLSKRTVSVEPMNNPASVSEDLVRSQSGAPTATSDAVGRMKGGRLLRAIKERTAALKTMLKQAYRGVTRRRSRK